MALSLYSFVTAVLWFSAFTLVGTLLQRRAGFLFCYRLVPLLLLAALTAVRLCIPIELPFTVILSSTRLFPAVQAFLSEPVPGFGSITVTWTQLLVAAWGTVAALLCARLFACIGRDSRAVRVLPRVACPEAEECLGRLLSREGRVRRVALAVSPEVPTPMLVGFFRPTILLPAGHAELNGDELEYVLRHELAHLSGGDLWVKLVIRLICRIMWWNPCVYLLQQDLDRILEHKCDLAVTRDMRTPERVAYLQAMLDANRQPETAQESAAVGAALCGTPGAEVAKRRLFLVLNQEQPYQKRPVVLFAAGLLALFLLSYCFVIQPASQPPAEDFKHEVFITPETCYLIEMKDGTYHIIVEGVDYGAISPTSMEIEAFRALTVLPEE